MDDLPGILFLMFAIFQPEEYDRLQKTKSLSRDDIREYIFKMYFLRVCGHESHDVFKPEYVDM